MCQPSSTVLVKENINPTDKEKKIFTLLLNVLRHSNLKTQLRVAGGWVRDKLLGKECSDIDIAVDDMMGQEFCEKVNEYLSYTGEKEHSISVIKSNPDQSKHLETAMMRICDTSIDFANLRSETYAENSRIPTMKLGTAKEDAYRRDLTINSMFYNINTNAVEDLTGRGVPDLRSGIINTPLDPKSTFLDDPLRVLRAVRFGARFGFELNEELKKAAADEEVKASLADKISRERIGHEIDLMMVGDHPDKAMTYICDLQLFSVVFRLPNNFEPLLVDGYDRLCVTHVDAAWKILQGDGCSMLNVCKFNSALIARDLSNFAGSLELSLLLKKVVYAIVRSIMGVYENNPRKEKKTFIATRVEQRRLYLYGALFLPLRKSVYTARKPNKNVQIPIVNYILQSSLKLKAKDAETVVSLHSTAERFICLITHIKSLGDLPPSSRTKILAGLLLRQIKEFWRAALLISTLLPVKDDAEKFHAEHGQLDLRKQFEEVVHTCVELDREEVWNVKPLLDGNAIMDVLQLSKGGREVGEWQQRVLKWQLAHPSGSVDECIDWVRQSQAKRSTIGLGNPN